MSSQNKLDKIFLQVWYTGHPDGAVEEFIAFTNPVLMESTAMANNAAAEDVEDVEDGVGMAQEMDELPQYRITKFTFYNREAQVLHFGSWVWHQYFPSYAQPPFSLPTLVGPALLP